jgi:hypothetical protein
MDYSVPGYLAPFVVTGMVVVLAAVLLVVRSALRRASSSGKEWPEKDQAMAFWSVAALLVGWFVVAFATSLAGFYRPPHGSPPTIQYGLLIPIVLGVVLFLTWPLLRRTLAIIPNTWLVGVQLYRALGVVFLVLYAGGHLPGLFALPAGIGDVLVGILAPFAAAAYARSPEGAIGRVRLWNLFGIADLVIAVTMGFLTSPSPFQVAAFDRPSELIAMFPLVLIPVFAVPLSILLHFASLQKLRQKVRQDHVTGYRAEGREQIGSSAHRIIG